MNRIHPTAVVGPGVELGDGNVVGPFAVLLGPCTIGDDNWIGPHVTIGTPAEMRGADHPAAWEEAAGHGGLVIGSKNVIRDFTNIHAPHLGQTVVGNECYVMNHSYVGHDGHLGDGVTLASTVIMGGRCRIGDAANLGLGAILHQRSVVGPGAMVGMGAVVTRPVPPWAKAYGNPCRVQGANVIGMERAGFDPATIDELEHRYAELSARGFGAIDAIGDHDAAVTGTPSELAGAFAWFEQARRLSSAG
jgi:UDP-N-acetylglucosamine acyltransferase